MNRDFRDMLCALNEAGADYLVVGAYAMAAHGHPRATGDFDLWIRPSAENGRRVLGALRVFGAPSFGLTEEGLAKPDVIVQIGLAPVRIDLITAVDGLQFEDAWPRRLEVEVDGVPIHVISRVDLIANKRAAARPKDLVDVRVLESDPKTTSASRKGGTKKRS